MRILNANFTIVSFLAGSVAYAGILSNQLSGIRNARKDVILLDAACLDASRAERLGKFQQHFRLNQIKFIIERVTCRTTSFTNILSCAVTAESFAVLYQDGERQKSMSNIYKLTMDERREMESMHELVYSYEWLGLAVSGSDARYHHAFILAYDMERTVKAFCFEWPLYLSDGSVYLKYYSGTDASLKAYRQFVKVLTLMDHRIKETMADKETMIERLHPQYDSRK